MFFVIIIIIIIIINDPAHDKTYKMACAPSENPV